MKIDRLLASALAIGLIITPLFIDTHATDSAESVWRAIERGPLTISTNGNVTFGGKLVARIDGTNYVAVPDVTALNTAHENGFALGVRYGAIALRRNPDVDNIATLTDIAKSILMSVQQQQNNAQKQKP